MSVSVSVFLNFVSHLCLLVCLWDMGGKFFMRLCMMICKCLQPLHCICRFIKMINFNAFFSQEYFGKFGELDSVKLKMDPMTGNLNI